MHSIVLSLSIIGRLLSVLVARRHDAVNATVTVKH